jgi:hypothetical protein
VLLDLAPLGYHWASAVNAGGELGIAGERGAAALLPGFIYLARLERALYSITPIMLQKEFGPGWVSHTRFLF